MKSVLFFLRKNLERLFNVIGIKTTLSNMSLLNFRQKNTRSKAGIF